MASSTLALSPNPPLSLSFAYAFCTRDASEWSSFPRPARPQSSMPSADVSSTISTPDTFTRFRSPGDFLSTNELRRISLIFDNSEYYVRLSDLLHIRMMLFIWGGSKIRTGRSRGCIYPKALVVEVCSLITTTNANIYHKSKLKNSEKPTNPQETQLGVRRRPILPY